MMQLLYIIVLTTFFEKMQVIFSKTKNYIIFALLYNKNVLLNSILCGLMEFLINNFEGHSRIYAKCGTRNHTLTKLLGYICDWLKREKMGIWNWFCTPTNKISFHPFFYKKVIYNLISLELYPEAHDLSMAFERLLFDCEEFIAGYYSDHIS